VQLLQHRFGFGVTAPGRRPAKVMVKLLEAPIDITDVIEDGSHDTSPALGDV